jgi:hypothetical protein
MLTSTVPMYNFLIEALAKYCDDSNSCSDIVAAVKVGLVKLNSYYTKTDDTTMYTVATGKLNIKITPSFK